MYRLTYLADLALQRPYCPGPPPEQKDLGEYLIATDYESLQDFCYVTVIGNCQCILDETLKNYRTYCNPNRLRDVPAVQQCVFSCTCPWLIDDGLTPAVRIKVKENIPLFKIKQEPQLSLDVQKEEPPPSLKVKPEEPRPSLNVKKPETPPSLNVKKEDLRFLVPDSD